MPHKPKAPRRKTKTKRASSSRVPGTVSEQFIGTTRAKVLKIRPRTRFT